jgi:hypothetical protein
MKYLSRFVLVFSLLLSIGLNAQEEPDPPDTSFAGAVWISPYLQECNTGEEFTTEVHVNTGTQLIAAYGINISFDSSVVEYLYCVEGDDGFLTAYNPQPESLITNGFDAVGKGPSEDLHLLTITWAVKEKTEFTNLGMTVSHMTDEMVVPTGDPTANDGYINVVLGAIEENEVLKTGVSVGSLNPGINIQYTLEKREKVKVEIYNILGQRLAKLIDGTSPSGKHNLTWNGSTGIYFAIVEIGNKVYKEKAIIIR